MPASTWPRTASRASLAFRSAFGLHPPSALAAAIPPSSSRASRASNSRSAYRWALCQAAETSAGDGASGMGRASFRHW